MQKLLKKRNLFTSQKELEMIKQALIRSKGKRKLAAEELEYLKEHFIEKLNNLTLMIWNKFIYTISILFLLV